MNQVARGAQRITARVRVTVGIEDLALVIGDHLRAAGYATLRGIGIKEVIDAQG